jgi:hypothetical protein
MKIGFTGTRFGMTDKQKEVIMTLRPLDIELHHGDCIGADFDMHQIAKTVKVNKIVIHPPVDEELRAFCTGDLLLPPKTHLARNRDIVHDTDLLIATPFGMEHQTHGGTWYTIDYALKLNKWIIIVFLDGSTKEYNAPINPL